jgi:hypothetical protein
MTKQLEQSLTLFEAPLVSERDKDAELKLRAARMLWHLGFVCPREVVISGKEIKLGALKRYDLTDLDVVGIKFDADLSFRTVIADCKSGKSSATNRLFWLRGVMDFFGADRGYLVQPQIGSEVREVALRLSVSLLDRGNLEKYETDKGLGNTNLESLSIRGYDRERALWGPNLPKGHQPTEAEKRLQRVYQYLSYGYWFNEEHRNVQQLLRVFGEAAAVINSHSDRERMKLLVYRGLTLWSISLLKMCGSVIATNSDEIHNEVRRYIFGGAASASERARLMRYFSTLQREQVPLEPPYYDELLELAARIIKFSQFGKDIPRYSDLVASEAVVCGRKENLEGVLGRDFSVDTLKLTKDVAVLMSKAADLDPSLFSELMTQ